MAHDPWILEEGVRPLIDVIVRASNTNAPDLHEHFSFPALGPRSVLKCKLTGLAANDAMH